MRRYFPAALLALAIASPAYAAGPDDVDPARPDARVASEVEERAEPRTLDAVPARPAPEMRLNEIQVEERAAADDETAAQWPQRGSFWWLVGVIVVAGVILALVL